MKSNSFWLAFLLLTFIVTLPISWWGMSKVDFFYSGLHDLIKIDKHIQTYAPRNRFNKKEFELTSKAERVNLFKGVVVAIHHQGVGLDTLSYTRASNQQVVRLFTEAEILHLKDVAFLLEKLKPIIVAITLCWLITILWVTKKPVKLPSAITLSKLALYLLITIALVFSFGPEKIFNQLHIWVFPENHQWFFYYEDSLMSTMMKAPFLFAYISAIWAFISIILTILILKLLHLTQGVLR